MPEQPANRGFNCPKCRAWILYKGSNTKCTNIIDKKKKTVCDWKINKKTVEILESAS